ncbi:hypothetical protein [Candidatus Endomicrobiellum trichonymphae]|uniref:hypothetical protein n=1 Tax=Endomicrobium trichonymphae TaxID=1408204 RepID=UPI00350E522F
MSDIVSKLHPFVAPIAVFSGQDEKAVSKIIKKCSIKNIQFNGNEAPEFCKFVRDRQCVKIFKFFKLDNETDILKLYRKRRLFCFRRVLFRRRNCEI